MAGVLIVEDEEGDVPSQVYNMPEAILFMQYFPLGTNPRLNTIATDSGDALTSVDFNAQMNDMVLINGLFRPAVTLTAGKYTRMRMIHSGTQSVMEVTVTGCTMELLAKDGVYLPTAPRAVTTAVLAPGTRADIAVMCSTVGMFTMQSGGARRRCVPHQTISTPLSCFVSINLRSDTMLLKTS
eukprot:6260864-Pyramimonas_sp.AAC.1